MFVLYFILPVQAMFICIVIYEFIDSLKQIEEYDRLQHNSEDPPH